MIDKFRQKKKHALIEGKIYFSPTTAIRNKNRLLTKLFVFFYINSDIGERYNIWKNEFNPKFPYKFFWQPRCYIFRWMQVQILENLGSI